MSEEEIKNLSIGIVSSRFNNDIVEKISKACISKLYTLGVDEKRALRFLWVYKCGRKIKSGENLSLKYGAII